MIVWGAVLPDITYRNKYEEVHRVNGTMINQNDANAELISKLGYKTVAVIHDTTDYGKGHNEYFSKALAKIGKAKIVGTFGVTADQQDFTAELTKIKALNPDVIYFGGLTPIGVRIRSQMDKLGIKAVLTARPALCRTPTSRDWVRWPKARWPSARAPRPRNCQAASSSWKNTMHRNTTIRRKPMVPFAYAAMDMILDTIEKVGPDRKKVIADLANVKDRDFDRRKNHVRRSRPEHGARHHQIRHAGRQVRRVGRQ